MDPEKHMLEYLESPDDVTHIKSRWGIRNRFRDIIASHDIPDDHKTEFMTHIHSALRPIGKNGIKRLESNLSDVGLHANETPVTRSLRNIKRAEEISKGQKPLVLGEEPLGSSRAAGMYDNLSGKLHLPLSLSQRMAKHISRDTGYTGENLHDEQIVPHVYMHEIAHAVDGRTSDDAISATFPWMFAWASELSKGQLTDYARYSPIEAFAEFARLAWTRPDIAKKNFPQSYKVFDEHGLIDRFYKPPRKPEKEPEKPPEQIKQQSQSVPAKSPILASSQKPKLDTGPHRVRSTRGQQRLFSAKRNPDGRST
jgi:hypothetical protein